jgi:hypothetical protein
MGYGFQADKRIVRGGGEEKPEAMGWVVAHFENAAGSETPNHQGQEGARREKHGATDSEGWGKPPANLSLL